MRTSLRRRNRTLYVFPQAINMDGFLKYLQENGLAKEGGEMRRLSNQRIPISQSGTSTGYIGVSAKPHDLSKTWIWETESSESIRDKHSDTTRHVPKRDPTIKRRQGRRPGVHHNKWHYNAPAPASDSAQAHSPSGEPDDNKGSSH